MVAWIPWLIGTGLAGLGITGSIATGNERQRTNLSGGGNSIFYDSPNFIDVQNLANWYHNHNTDEDIHGYTDRKHSPLDWVNEGRWWDSHRSNNPERFQPLDDGVDDLKDAFAYARQIYPDRYIKHSPVSIDSMRKAYQLYANDGWFERGDSGNLWDIYATSPLNVNNPEYAKMHDINKQAKWIADYMEDVNYLAKLAAEEDAWKSAYNRFNQFATRNDASGSDRAAFRSVMDRVHKARLQNPDRFLQVKNNSSNPNPNSVNGNNGNKDYGSNTYNWRQ